MMFRIVGFQIITSLVVALVAGPFGGWPAAGTALFGGLACALPNALFALHLTLASRMRDRMHEGMQAPAGASALASATALLLGEIGKLILTFGLLVLLARIYAQIHWLVLILTICAVLLVQPFAVLWRPKPTPIKELKPSPQRFER
jgi:ATP synthase protein I